MVQILNDSFSEELRDYAIATDEKSRSSKIAQLDEKRKNIDYSTENGKLDSRSYLEEALALVFVNRMIVAEKMTKDEVTATDINSSILGELLEYFNITREQNWRISEDKFIGFKNSP